MRAASRSGSAWKRDFPRESSLDDPSFQLRVMADRWDEAFRDELTRTDRNLLAVAGVAEAAELGRSKDELMRLRYEAEARRATPRPEVLVAETSAGLTPWRDLVQPHEDVAAAGLDSRQFPQDVQDMLAAAGASELPTVRRVVLVGNQLRPGQPETKSDGTTGRRCGASSPGSSGRPRLSLSSRRLTALAPTRELRCATCFAATRRA
jgi:hypothetical protein